MNSDHRLIKYINSTLDYAEARVDDNKTPFESIVREVIKRLSLAKVEYQRIYSPQTAPSLMDYIGELVADFYDVPYSRMRSKSRVQGLAHARFVAWYLQQLYTESTLQAIGDFWAFRDHSTIYHGVENVKKKLIRNKSYRLQVEHLENLIQRYIDERRAA